MTGPIDYGKMAGLLVSLMQPVADPIWNKKQGILGGLGTEGARSRPAGGGHAKIGGETGINGYQYKGGQFLPSTDAPPGTFRVGRKVVKAKRYEIEPGRREVQQTPTSRSVYHEAAPGFYTRLNADRSGLELNPGAGGGGVRDYQGNPVTLQTKIGNRTLGELIQLYNSGVRWLPE
jgi:hypothetical protein